MEKKNFEQNSPFFADPIKAKDREEKAERTGIWIPIKHTWININIHIYMVYIDDTNNSTQARLFSVIHGI